MYKLTAIITCNNISYNYIDNKLRILHRFYTHTMLENAPLLSTVWFIQLVYDFIIGTDNAELFWINFVKYVIQAV